jgi:Protein of unknown function (DUF1203)
MSFRVSALPMAPFAPLFDLDGVALAARGAVRRVADASPGFPCRVSLRDADVGETVVLVHYEHHAVASPFRASHAVYVRQGALEASPEPGEVPDMLRRRLLSIRAYDASGMMVGADIAEGADIERVIASLLAGPAVAYLHAHIARPGCYAARIDPH